MPIWPSLGRRSFLPFLIMPVWQRQNIVPNVAPTAYLASCGKVIERDDNENLFLPNGVISHPSAIGAPERRDVHTVVRTTDLLPCRQSDGSDLYRRASSPVGRVARGQHSGRGAGQIRHRLEKDSRCGPWMGRTGDNSASLDSADRNA
jgi:hypothetical protein